MLSNPGIYNKFIILIGATFNTIVAWFDQNYYPINLTGFSAIMEMRYNIADASPFATLSTENGGIILEAEIGDCTISIASPALITVANNISEGTPIKFSTTGELPTGMMAGQVYFAYNVTANSFNISSTQISGCNAIITPVITTGMQSGTQSANLCGTLSLLLDAESTALLTPNNSAVYDIQFTDPLGEIGYLLQGQIVLQEMVTRS